MKIRPRTFGDPVAWWFNNSQTLRWNTPTWIRRTRWPLTGGRADCSYLTILDKVDQQVRTKPNVRISVSRHGTTRGTGCMKGQGFVTTRNGCIAAGYMEKGVCALWSGPMGVSIVHWSFQACFWSCRCEARFETGETSHREWMPGRTCARVCLTHVICQLNTWKSDVEISCQWQDAWCLGRSRAKWIEHRSRFHTRRWTRFAWYPYEHGDKPEQHFVLVTLLRTSTVAGEIEENGGSQGVLSWISGAAISKKRSQLLNLAMSTDVKPINCCDDTDEVVIKFCFVHWVWGARQNRTVFDTAAGELIGLLVEIRVGIIVSSSDMFQPAKPSFPLASRCVGCRRHDGEAEVRDTFFSKVATTSVHNSTNVSSLRGGFTSSYQLVVLIVRTSSILATRKPTDIDLCCVPSGLPLVLQPAAKMPGIRCDAAAGLHWVCHPYKPMPTPPSYMQDSFVFVASADSPFLSLLFR